MGTYMKRYQLKNNISVFSKDLNYAGAMSVGKTKDMKLLISFQLDMLILLS